MYNILSETGRLDKHAQDDGKTRQFSTIDIVFNGLDETRGKPERKLEIQIETSRLIKYGARCLLTH
jgi:hypothetical protein